MKTKTKITKTTCINEVSNIIESHGLNYIAFGIKSKVFIDFEIISDGSEQINLYIVSVEE